MNHADLDPVAEVLHAASRPRNYMPTLEAARSFLAGSLANDGAHNLVALRRGEVVGYTCALRPRGQVAGCGPIAVHPEHNDTGLAAQLLMRTISAANQAGIGLLRHPLAVHKSTFCTVYGRMKLDFTSETYIRLERRPASAVPAPEAHDVRLLSATDLPRVVTFDRELFVNADRTRDYRLILEELGGRGWTVERDGELRGFVFVTPGVGIGPLAAIDPSAATDALRVATAFSHREGRDSNVHINAADRHLVEEAIRLDYVCREPVLLFERSFDGRKRRPLSRGPYCIGLLGIP